jgi:hypothetical protein
VFERRWRLLTFSTLVALLIRQYLKTRDFQSTKPPTAAADAVENIDQNSSDPSSSVTISSEEAVAGEGPDPDITLIEPENLVSAYLCVENHLICVALFSLEAHGTHIDIILEILHQRAER